MVFSKYGPFEDVELPRSTQLGEFKELFDNRSSRLR
jgi:hypothetical protein